MPKEIGAMRLLFIIALCLPAMAARWEFGSGIGFYRETTVASPPEPIPSPVTVKFFPVPLSVSSASIGSGREAGAWRISVCSRADREYNIPLPMVLESYPDLNRITGEFVTRLITQRTARHPARIAAEVLEVAGVAVVAIGIQQDDKNMAAIAAGGAAVLRLGTQILKPRLDTAPVYNLPNPCPDMIPTQPGACYECNVLAGLMRGASVVGPVPVRLP